MKQILTFTLGLVLLTIRSLWLMRPNDEERLEEGNINIAKNIAREWIKEVAPPLRTGGEQCHYNGRRWILVVQFVYSLVVDLFSGYGL